MKIIPTEELITMLQKNWFSKTISKSSIEEIFDFYGDEYTDDYELKSNNISRRKLLTDMKARQRNERQADR